MNAEKKTLKTAMQKWEDFFASKGRGLACPDENLVRLFKGKYLDLPKEGRLLDCGFGSGNNLVFFHSLGYQCYGLEVAQSAINIASNLFKGAPKEPAFALLEGTDYPYEDNFFDIVVSWNCLHYNGNIHDVKKVIAELHRIIKPGGCLLLSTISHEHMLPVNGEELERNQFRVKDSFTHDNRAGVTVYSPENKEDMFELFADFKDLKYGYTKAFLFDDQKINACHLVFGRK